jgi:nucleotide-binding universal stress UspA family protein
MYRRTLVPLDGSPLAEHALPHAIALARATGGGLHLVRVTGARRASAGDLSPEEGYLAGVARRVRDAGIGATIALRAGDAVDEIVAEAADGADLIAMATHGRGGLGRVLFGSVAAAVLSRSTVPVLLVRAWLPAAQAVALGPAPLILVPLDGSAYAEAALPPAAALARALDGRLLLLRVVPPETPATAPLLLSSGELDAGQLRLLQEARDGHLAEAGVYLDQVVSRLAALGHSAEREVRAGPVAATIVAAKREHGAALIAMTSRGYAGARRLVIGDVADAVLREGTRPLLLIGPGARAAAPGDARVETVVPSPRTAVAATSG